MGLDITVYKNIKLEKAKEDVPEDYDGYDDDLIYLYINPHFKQQAEEIRKGWYSGEEVFDFRAGGYGGYNGWREKLAKLADYISNDEDGIWCKENEGKPFWDLVNFSDCEGVIDSKTSKKLFNDFKEFDEKAAKEMVVEGNYGNYNYEKYQDWMKAFELASENGCVSFH